MQIGLFGPFACQFRHAGDGFAFLFVFGDFLYDDVGDVRILVQIVVHLFFDEVAHELVYADSAVGYGGQRPQFDFRLAFEERFFDVDGDARHQSVTDVAVIEVLAREIFDGLGNVFLEGTLMRAALGCMLSVDERIIFLAVLSRVGKGNFYVFSFQVDDRIEPVVGHIVVQQVYQPVAGMDAASVEHDGQSRVQVRIVAQHRFDEFGTERIVLEQSTVRFEIDESSVFVGCRFR